MKRRFSDYPDPGLQLEHEVKLKSTTINKLRDELEIYKAKVSELYDENVDLKLKIKKLTYQLEGDKENLKHVSCFIYQLGKHSCKSNYASRFKLFEEKDNRFWVAGVDSNRCEGFRFGSIDKFFIQHKKTIFPIHTDSCITKRTSCDSFSE